MMKNILGVCLFVFTINSHALPDVEESINYSEYADASMAAETRQPQTQNYANTASKEEKVLDNTMLLAKISELEEEISKLRGQLEVQAHDMKLLSQQQLTFYKDLETRLTNMQTPTSSNKQSPTKQKQASLDEQDSANVSNADYPKSQTQETNAKGSDAAITSTDEQLSYVAAYELIKAKQYDKALPALKAFLIANPKSPYVPNAHYWLGELLLAERQILPAINEFTKVINKYPDSNKVASSEYKLGVAYYALGQTNKAVEQFNKVTKDFPDTSTARLAKRQLENINRSL